MKILPPPPKKKKSFKQKFNPHCNDSLKISMVGLVVELLRSRLFTVPLFSVGFSRPVRFDGAAAILVCKSERDLGRVSKVV